MTEETEVEITHNRGLHLTPAGIFAEEARKFDSDIKVGLKGEKKWDGKQVTGLLSIGAVKGARIIINAEGSDASEALKVLKELVEDDFGLDD